MSANLEKEIFSNACDFTDPEERRRYLDRACRGDPQLRARIERLLQVTAATSSLLDQEPIEILSPAQVAPQPGERLGTYTLVRKRDEGGLRSLAGGFGTHGRDQDPQEETDER